MFRQTLPLQAPGEASITSAFLSGVKRTKSSTCEPGLLNASPGSMSHGFSTSDVMAGRAIVVKWVARPQAALTKEEQSTPETSGRGSSRVQMFPASVPLSSALAKVPSDAMQPQQYGMP